ncbi:hypothetical protein PQX77_022163 [Marasmius sp. AFHP31]|nr:hypothetical protein PQX77_022163 [Marasmius sp. AFHP31]
MPSPAAEVDPEDRNSVEEQYKYGILLPIIISSIHLFLYGLNVLLFRVGLVVLRRRKRQVVDGGHRLFRISLVSLFVLSSVGVPISLVWDVLVTRVALCQVVKLECALVQMDIALQALNICRVVIAALMCSIVDVILVFRCFVICGWRRKSWAIILIVCCLILDAASPMLVIWPIVITLDNAKRSDALLLGNLGIVCASLHFTVNAVFTAIIASKLLRSERHISKVTGKTPARFRMVARLLVESCLLYLVAWIIFVACETLHRGGELTSILVQVAGIAPTLLMVRANLNRYQEGEDIPFNSQIAPTVPPSLPLEERIALDISRDFD